MARNTLKHKREIIATIESLGEASPSDIRAALGPAWAGETKRVELQQTLGRLTKKHLVEHSGYGWYTLPANAGLRSIDVHDQTENEIAEFLRTCGGIARTLHIHKAIYDRPAGLKDRDHDYKRVTLALKESPLFRQDFRRGYWNLLDEEREVLPMLGKWASVQIKRDWFGNDERGDFASWDAKRDDFFNSVGSAFVDASDEWNSAELVQVSGVRDALQVMAKNAPGAKDEAREAFWRRLEREERERGVTDVYALAQAARDGGEGWLEHLYAMFLVGDARAHLAAPVEFYRACAEVFAVCPARLSRGEVVPVSV
jgi:hypothetical protein